MTQRRDELQRNLDNVYERIALAAAVAGREAGEVTLIVVTKTWPASDVVLLAELGVTNVGENRDQEAAAKYRDVQLSAPQLSRELTWHFIGQLQTNKAKSVARYADIVHSVDRLRLVTALDRAAAGRDRPLRCLVQVQLDSLSDRMDEKTKDNHDRPGRGGAGGSSAFSLAEAIAAAEWLELAGVMGVAPLGEDAGHAFAHLRAVAAELQQEHPEAKIISAGMSGDLETAVAQGATHVRVGSAVLGGRPPFG